MFLDTDHVEERRGAFEVAVGARTKLFTNKPLARGKNNASSPFVDPLCKDLHVVCIYIYIYPVFKASI